MLLKNNKTDKLKSKAERYVGQHLKAYPLKKGGTHAMKINGIRFITPEEVNSMPLVDLLVTKASIGSKDSDIKREMYYVDVKFDRLTSRRMNITSDDYALLHFYSERKYIADQFLVRARARIVETKWPDKDGRPAHSSYMLQVYCTEELKWEQDVTKQQFINVYLKSIKNGELKEFLPVIRIPGNEEREVTQEEKDPNNSDEKLPF